MPLCTYMDAERAQRCRETLDDPEMQELLDDANRFDEGRWLIGRMRHTSGRLWWKKEFEWYFLYVGTKGTEYQCINLVPHDPDGKLPVRTTNRGDVANFLLGYVSGRVAERNEVRK